MKLKAILSLGAGIIFLALIGIVWCHEYAVSEFMPGREKTPVFRQGMNLPFPILLAKDFLSNITNILLNA